MATFDCKDLRSYGVEENSLRVARSGAQTKTTVRKHLTGTVIPDTYKCLKDISLLPLLLFLKTFKKSLDEIHSDKKL